MGLWFLKQWKPKAPPSISLPGLRPWGEVFLVYYHGVRLGSRGVGTVKFILWCNTAEEDVIGAWRGRTGDFCVWVSGWKRKKDRQTDRQTGLLYWKKSHVGSPSSIRCLTKNFQDCSCCARTVSCTFKCMQQIQAVSVVSRYSKFHCLIIIST